MSTTTDPAVDYFPHKIVPRFAEIFSVEYERHFKIVHVHLPDGDSRIVLVQCGTPRPEGYDDATTFVDVPVRSIVTTSTTELPHLVELGVIDTLVGHDEFDYVSSPAVRRRIDAGAVAEVGETFRINVEIVLDLEPDLLLAAGLASKTSDAFDRLDDAGIAVVHVPSFLEASPLGRAEWILMTALFFNKENEASVFFDGVARRYEEWAAKGRARLADGPTVIASGPEGDTWYMPGGRSFMAQLIADAGGRYLWADNTSTGSIPLSLETVFERALDADVWLHPSRWGSLEEISQIDERFRALQAFRMGRIYSNGGRMNSTGGNDYWETGTARPDMVLKELVSIFHPDLATHQLGFHYRLR